MSPPLSRVLELRRYTLHPGRRDTLVALFERHFVEPQEALGMAVPGTFRDLDAPDHFVWLRGFADMAARGDALPAFYRGPVWQAWREEANATMVDSDDVHLLRPLGPADGFGALPPRAAVDAAPPAGEVLLTATVCPLLAPPDEALAAAFERHVRPAWSDADATLLAAFATEPAANNFPALPVHEQRPVLAWFTRFAGVAAQARHAARVAAEGVLDVPAFRARLAGAPHTARLAPTHRSALR